MTPGRLNVVSAGAGSGKTTRLCDEIAREVIDNSVDPARVLGTTFTRLAAAELKGRTQRTILRREDLPLERRLELAERLELALVGTVHAVGHRLLKRYALPMGLSPRVEILAHDEEHGDEKARHHVRRLLGAVPSSRWDALLPPARRLGLDRDIADTLLRILEVKRTNAVNDDAFREQMLASAERYLAVLSGGEEPVDVEGYELQEAARQALAQISGLTDETGVTKQALVKLRRLARDRSLAWSSWVEAAGLKAGKRSGADAQLTRLRSLGATARRSAALHADVREFLHHATEAVLELGEAYDGYKRERALLDYIDLEVLFLRLLERPDLADSLREELQLVLVDEFQDTSPIQLAIFLRLRELAQRSVWVGDPKQAIYGFRGADTELVAAAWDNARDAERDRLGSSWRSTSGLVGFAAKLFDTPFEGDAELEAKRGPGDLEVERWILSDRNASARDAALSHGIRGLTDGGVARPDIAVLVRTNRHAHDLAAQLARDGVPALSLCPGLLGTRECRIAMAGLRLVADRYDALAATILLHLITPHEGGTPTWFEARLREVREARERGTRPAPFAGHPVLAPFDDLDARAADPSGLVEAVVVALDLGQHLASWGDPTRRAANLDAFGELARAYEKSTEQLGQAATLTGFLQWCSLLEETEQDWFPQPRGSDAVTVCTWHAAKGLEWPTVILTDLHRLYPPDLFKPVVRGGLAADGHPLEGRQVGYWPWPFGDAKHGLGLREDVLDTADGRATQEAGKREDQRLLYVGVTRARDRLVLAHQDGKTDWLDLLPEWRSLLSDEPGEHAIPGTGATLRVVRLAVSQESGSVAPADGSEAWIDAPRREPAPEVDRFHSPSKASTLVCSEESSVHTELLPGPHPFSVRIGTEERGRLGNAVHAYLAALPSLPEAGGEDLRSVVAERVLDGHGVTGVIEPSALVAAGDRLAAWVERRYPEATWHTEVAVRGPRAGGGTWFGTIDLLLGLPDGKYALLDHKTTDRPESMWAAEAASHAGQINAYAEACGDLEIADAWIHFPLAGGLARI